jgi:cytoskeletal protein RodZ
MGTVLLNQAFQATTTTTLESLPSDPVILDLSLDFIDNMLIVSPPKKSEETSEEQQSSDLVDPILDFNELDIDYLAEERLGEEGLEFTELDYDALNVNFLEDLLDIISELDKIQDEDRLAQEATTTTIKGTSVGQDTKTQITTIVTGEKIKMTRAVGSNAAINIDSGNSYTVVLEQNGVVNEVKVNGGSASTIVIRQSSG